MLDTGEGRVCAGLRGAASVVQGVLAVLGVTTLVLAAGCASEAPDPGGAAPVTVGPLVERAERAMQRGDPDAAIAAYQEAVELTPWNSRVVRALAAAHAERGARYRDQGSLPSAERDLRRALELQPDDPELRFNLAVVLIERADLDLDSARAARLRAEAAELAPELHAGSPQVDALLERRLDLAYQLLERGQLEAGASRLAWMQADYPDEPRVARLRAQAEVALGSRLYEAGNFSDAALHYGRAVSLYGECAAPVCSRSELALAHQNRVVALFEAGRTAEARAALDEAEAQGLSFPQLRAMLPAYDFE